MSKYEKICCYCGRQLIPALFTIEHLVPSSKGGTDSRINKRICCYSCNQWRANLDLEIWRQLLEGLSSMWGTWPFKRKGVNYSGNDLETMIQRVRYWEKYIQLNIHKLYKKKYLMNGFWTIFEDAKGDRRFYMGDRIDLVGKLNNVRLLGVAFISCFPVNYPIRLNNGDFIYDDFPSFAQLPEEIATHENDWPNISVEDRFDFDMSLSEIDYKFGNNKGIVRKKGVKVSPPKTPKKDIKDPGFKNPYPYRLNAPKPYPLANPDHWKNECGINFHEDLKPNL
jgi:hypothetical protein